MFRLIIGAIIGSIGASLAKQEKKGCLMNILAGVVGSYVGHALFGQWGPRLADMAVFPSILGATIVTIVVGHFTGRK